MNRNLGSAHVVKLPAARRDMLQLLDVYWWKHSMYALLEVDVTIARQFIAAHKAHTGETLSFTGYMTFCLAQAVAVEPTVQAYRKGRTRLIVVDDVDVGLMIERTSGGTRAPMGYVVRQANHKTFLEIHQEIRTVQARPASPNTWKPSWARVGLALPWSLSKLFITLLRAAFRREPTLIVAQAGTVGVTAVGMFGKGSGSGWGLTPTSHTLDLIVGSIVQKPVVVVGHIEPREILNLTMAFDHDVVDGAPATRFVRRLVELIESGYGLGEDQPTLSSNTIAATVHSLPLPVVTESCYKPGCAQTREC